MVALTFSAAGSFESADIRTSANSDGVPTNDPI
jgi:hypothetical protein